MSFNRFVFLGAPGVGKGTFAKLLCKNYDLHHFSVGDALRKHVELGTDLGNQLSSSIKSGKLVPDEVVNKIVSTELLAFENRNKGFILDGYPRTLSQAQYLDDTYVNVVEKKLIAVHIMLDREVTIQKLLGRRLCKTCGKSFNTAHIVERGFDMPAILPDQKTCQFTRGNQKCEPIFERRDDDTAQVIEKRLEDFDARNNCILEFYRERNALRSFEVKKGVKDVDSLWKAMSQ